ncbi:MAG: M28 family peptidase [Actinobacteria bacterium]|nr:M28 family peptidase [Actinomycetota bacterium]
MGNLSSGDWSGLRDEVSRANVQKHTETIFGWERHAGTPAERQAVAYIKEYLDQQGIDAKVEEFDSLISNTVRASVTILAGDRRAVQCITHPFSKSVPAGVTAEAIHPGDKIDEVSVAGKIVIVDDTDAPRNANRLQDRGAAAMICHSRGRALQDYIISQVWGTPEPGTVKNLPGIPVVTLDGDAADHLEALMRDGPVQVTVRTELDTGIKPMHFPVADIKGTAGTDEFVLLAGHMDSWYFGAQDNAVGNASLMEVARVLSQHRELLKRNVRIAWWVGHSHGRFAASTWYCDNRWEDLTRNCVGYLNVDQPGFRDADFLKCFSTPDAARYISGMVKNLADQDVWPPRPPRAADQSFWGAGLPSFSYLPRLHENSGDEAPDELGARKPWYQHSPFDTLDKIDFNLLAEQTYYFANTMADLSTRSILPWDHADVADAFLKRLNELNIAGGTALDLAPCIEDAWRLKDAGSRVRAVGNVTPDQQQRLNRAIRRASQLLLPVFFTEEGRYHPAPAAQMPLLPGLRELPQLAKMSSHSEQHLFLRTKLMRERNRVTESLRWASEALRAGLPQ